MLILNWISYLVSWGRTNPWRKKLMIIDFVEFFRAQRLQQLRRQNCRSEVIILSETLIVYFLFHIINIKIYSSFSERNFFKLSLQFNHLPLTPMRLRPTCFLFLPLNFNAALVEKFLREVNEFYFISHGLYFSAFLARKRRTPELVILMEKNIFWALIWHLNIFSNFRLNSWPYIVNIVDMTSLFLKQCWKNKEVREPLILRN